MNIGIIVYSKTGNTMSVAQKLKDQLEKDNKTVILDRIEATGIEKGDINSIELTKIPDPSHYEVIVFCSPVQAFSLNPVMKKYLLQVSSIENKKTLCFVTMHFPYRWMGGKNAISYMKKDLIAKKALLTGEGIISWSKKDRESQIDELVNYFTNII